MKLRPGPGWIWIGGSFAAVALGCFVWSSAAWLIAPVAGAGIALTVADWIILRRSITELSVSRELPGRAAQGNSFEVVLNLVNRQQGCASGEIRDVIPPGVSPRAWQQKIELAAGRGVSARYHARAARRGKYVFGPVWIRLHGKYRMLEHQRKIDCTGTVRVIPSSALTVKDAFHKNLRTENRFVGEWTRTRLRGHGIEFESLDRFHEGDDPRRIDWRSTARRGNLMVRRYQVEQHQDLLVLLDCGRLMGAAMEEGNKLDQAVDSAIMLSRVALAKGDRCGIGMFDDRMLGFLPPRAGPGALQTIVAGLSDAKCYLRETDFGPMFATLRTRCRKRSLVIVLSDIAGIETTRRFRQALRTLARQHVVILAALQTPLLADTLMAPVRSGPDVSRKAVVMRLLREREKSLHSLTRSGVTVLDVKPDQLTVPLINRYIDLRERNTL